MQYKTVVLHLLESQPLLSEKLRASNSLLSTMEVIAMQLRTNHLQLVEQLQTRHSEMPVEQIRNQALEYQLDQLKNYLDLLATEADQRAISASQIQNSLLRMMTK